jgi:hypothetical protein
MASEAPVLSNRRIAGKHMGPSSSEADDLILQNKANLRAACCAKQSQFRGASRPGVEDLLCKTKPIYPGGLVVCP